MHTLQHLKDAQQLHVMSGHSQVQAKDFATMLPVSLSLFTVINSHWQTLIFKSRYKQTKNKLRGFSPQANHTDRVTAAGRRC
jgi:hypothetical protein